MGQVTNPSSGVDRDTDPTKLGIRVCFDYAIYRMTKCTKLQSNDTGYSDVVKLCEQMKYQKIAALSAPLMDREKPWGLLPMNAGDVFLMPAHAGYVNGKDDIDHFLQQLTRYSPRCSPQMLQKLGASADSHNSVLYGNHQNLKLGFNFLKFKLVHPDSGKTVESKAPSGIPRTSVDFWSVKGFLPQQLEGEWIEQGPYRRPLAVTSVSGGSADGEYIGRKSFGSAEEDVYSFCGSFDGFNLNSTMTDSDCNNGSFKLSMTIDDDGYRLEGIVSSSTGVESMTFRKSSSAAANASAKSRRAAARQQRVERREVRREERQARRGR